jgi:hypothetical protein
MKMRIALIAIAVLGWAVCAQAGVIYDLAADFSSTNNPNGAWSYIKYTAGVDPTHFGLYDTVVTNHGANAEGLIHWRMAGAADPGCDGNMTGATIYAPGWGNIAWPPHSYAIGAFGGPGAARWTAPSDGTINWTAAFTGIQEAQSAANVYVLKNADTVLFNGGPAAWNVTVSSSGSDLAVSAGDTIDFVVDGNKTTRVAATIDLVPEPSTLVLLVTGLIGLVCYAWRKRK